MKRFVGSVGSVQSRVRLGSDALFVSVLGQTIAAVIAITVCDVKYITIDFKQTLRGDVLSFGHCLRDNCIVVFVGPQKRFRR